MKIYKKIAVLFICLLLVFTIAPAFSKTSHRYHTSLTRIDFNREGQLLEISIQLFKHDLEPLLERKYKTRVDLEKSKETDALILNYLNEEFVIADPSGQTKKLKWVGKETDVDTIWIYLEAASAASPEGYSLRNTIFFESFPEQINLVICRYGEHKVDLLFKVGDKMKRIAAVGAK